VNSKGEEIIHDRNYETKNRYSNIFEMRKYKNNYLHNILPTKVKNHIFVNYENVRDNPIDFLKALESRFSLRTKTPDYITINYYKKNKDTSFYKCDVVDFSLNTIHIILMNLDNQQEKTIGYDLNKYYDLLK
jgi:hypothetical protein